jgi:hypothetical protein
MRQDELPGLVQPEVDGEWVGTGSGFYCNKSLHQGQSNSRTRNSSMRTAGTIRFYSFFLDFAAGRVGRQELG